MTRTSGRQVICFLGRKAGLRCFEALLDSAGFRVVGLFTHRKKPKSEDPARSERPEFKRFKELAARNLIPLNVFDRKEESARITAATLPEFDFVLSCSWRYQIAADVIAKARMGSVNLHRGKLPNYKGAEPVKRAIQNHDREVTLTAHEMVQEIDAGRVLAEITIPTCMRAFESIDEAVERIKRELEPRYPEAMFQAFKRWEEDHANVHYS